jgi:hypothetical protein
MKDENIAETINFVTALFLGDTYSFWLFRQETD